MNLYLHGIDGEADQPCPIETGDSLIADPGTRYQMVLTNPPFGKKSSITLTNSDGKADKEALTYERQDFWATTSNKQLNFLQHVKTLLEINGKAAIVVPDNVLLKVGLVKRLGGSCYMNATFIPFSDCLQAYSTLKE
jgi:type I restriction enzyme M protein